MTARCRIRQVIAAYLALFVLASVAGCSFKPEFPEGTIACTAGQANACPPGFSCAAGFCRSRPAGDGAADTPNLGEVAMPVFEDASAVDQGADETGPPVDASGRIDVVSGDDAKPAVDQAADSAIDRGTGSLDGHLDGTDALLSADTASDKPFSGDGADAIVDAPADTFADVPVCAESCKPGDTRCVPAGVQTCTIVNGCPIWSLAVPCDGRKICQSGSCVCAVAPVGCESGGGSVCVGNTLRTCKIGEADGCIYEDSLQVCAPGKPCQGAFPSAACTCPPSPTACSGIQGTYCESSSIVVTCGLDPSGCLATTQRTACASDKPCAGAFPSANCSCGPGPTECANSTGTVCVGTGKIETCALDGTGCLAVASIVDCPTGTTCQGQAPNAACLCPPTPAECSQGVGDSCNSQGQLVTCVRDSNNCLGVASRVTCPGVTKCQGSFPRASCVCPAPPTYCTGKGNVCVDGATLATCMGDNEGCLTSTTISCAPAGQTCQGKFPDAVCACPITVTCPTGEGSRCGDDTTLITCSTTSGGCLVQSTVPCKSGQYCSGDAPKATCVVPTPVGWYDDLRSEGSKAFDTLLGHSISIKAPSILRGFGVISRGAGTAQFALYSSTSNGPPSLLVANTDVVTLALGRNEFVSTPFALLQPGTYWIMGVYKTTTSIAQDASTTAVARSVGHKFLTDLPNPIGTTTPVIGSGQTNYYILTTPK